MGGAPVIVDAGSLTAGPFSISEEELALEVGVVSLLFAECIAMLARAAGVI